MISVALCAALAAQLSAASAAPSPVLGRLAVERQTASIFGVRTVYYEAGSGPPLILLSKIDWDASSFWFRNLPALARERRVIALDLVGLGESDKPLLDYTMRTWTEWIAEFMRVMKIPRASIAGVEMGGALAVQFALEFPDKCDAIVIAATNSGPGHLAPAIPPAGPRTASSLEAMRRALERNLFDQALVTDALVRARYEARLASNDAYTMNRHLSDHRAPYSPEELSRVAVPSLVVWCDEDQITPASWGKAYADALKGSTWVALRGCGHLPNLERPSEFNDAVTRFLKPIGR